ncbi:MAG: DNA-binding protein [Geobacteraceae bacterium]
MKTGRFLFIVTMAVIVYSLLVGFAFAGFGFGGDDAGESGLDFYKGYDVNTVRTISGQVVSPIGTGEQEQNIVEIKSGSRSVILSLAPQSFLDTKSFSLNVDDQITAKGSLAQGRDGKIYMMVQKITNRTSGAQLSLRNNRGKPDWSMKTGSGMRWNMPWGGMMRGGGMMHGGGGMMRH